MRMTRREMLAGLGLAAGWACAAIPGCENNVPPIVENLPDPLSSIKPDQLVDAVPYAPPSAGPPPPTRPASRPATGPTTRRTVIAPPSPPEPPVSDTLIPRSAWARGGPILSRIEPMDGVQLITFHHSGDPSPFYDDTYSGTASHLENVRTWHIHPVVSHLRPQGAGMCDIGYHYAIDCVGRVWELRNQRFQGEHVAGHNPHNLGVVVLGNFDLQSPTAAQWTRIISFGTQLRHQFRLPIARVFTHQELKSTACPGRNMQPQMVSIRRQGRI